MDQERGDDDVEDADDEHDGHGDVDEYFSSFSIGNIMTTFLQSLLHVSASKEGNANQHHNGGDSTNNTTNQVNNPEYNGASLQVQAYAGLFYDWNSYAHCGLIILDYIN